MKTTLVLAAVSSLALSLAAGCATSQAPEQTAGSASHLETDCEEQLSSCITECGGDTPDCEHQCNHSYEICNQQNHGPEGEGEGESVSRGRGNARDCDAEAEQCHAGCGSDDDGACGEECGRTLRACTTNSASE